MESEEPKLYLVEARRWIEADYARGIELSDFKYSGKKIVVASREEDADGRLISYLNKYLNKYLPSRKWEIYRSQELTAGEDISLDKRIEILGEILEVI